MVEAWGIRGWSLKVWEEPLSTGSSQNESCYLILLSTLLRFIRQLLDALQYAVNRARIVRRRRSRSPRLSARAFPLRVSPLHPVIAPFLSATHTEPSFAFYPAKYFSLSVTLSNVFPTYNLCNLYIISH